MTAVVPLRLGIVGAGRVVERVHLPLILERTDVRVAALFDADGTRSAGLARPLGAAACASLEELLGSDLDAVLVACPNHQHAAVTLAALDAGLHVLCEKPMATSRGQAEAMVRASERADRELTIAFPSRHRPEIEALRQALRDGVLGEIRSVRCGWLRREGVPGIGTWFTRRDLSGGGVLTDLGSHLLDLVFCLVGPRPLASATVRLAHGLERADQASWYTSGEAGHGAADVEISASGFALLEGPLDLFLEVSWASAVPRDRTYLELAGTDGVARLETLFGFSPNGLRPRYPLRIWPRQGRPQRIEGSPDVMQPYRALWSRFVEGLARGERRRADLAEAAAAVAAVEALYRAAEQPRDVLGGVA
jgi:predicted dehydrogenase